MHKAGDIRDIPCTEIHAEHDQQKGPAKNAVDSHQQKDLSKRTNAVKHRARIRLRTPAERGIKYSLRKQAGSQSKSLGDSGKLTFPPCCEHGGKGACCEHEANPEENLTTQGTTGEGTHAERPLKGEVEPYQQRYHGKALAQKQQSQGTTICMQEQQRIYNMTTTRLEGKANTSTNKYEMPHIGEQIHRQVHPRAII